MSGPPPNYDPNASMLSGGGGAAPPIINMHGGGLPSDYTHGGYKESVLVGGDAPIVEMKGGGKDGLSAAVDELDPRNLAARGAGTGGLEQNNNSNNSSSVSSSSASSNNNSNNSSSVSSASSNNNSNNSSSVSSASSNNNSNNSSSVSSASSNNNSNNSSSVSSASSSNNNSNNSSSMSSNSNSGNKENEFGITENEFNKAKPNVQGASMSWSTFTEQLGGGCASVTNTNKATCDEVNRILFQILQGRLQKYIEDCESFSALGKGEGSYDEAEKPELAPTVEAPIGAISASTPAPGTGTTTEPDADKSKSLIDTVKELVTPPKDDQPLNYFKIPVLGDWETYSTQIFNASPMEKLLYMLFKFLQLNYQLGASGKFSSEIQYNTIQSLFEGFIKDPPIYKLKDNLTDADREELKGYYTAYSTIINPLLADDTLKVPPFQLDFDNNTIYNEIQKIFRVLTSPGNPVKCLPVFNSKSENVLGSLVVNKFIPTIDMTSVGGGQYLPKFEFLKFGPFTGKNYYTVFFVRDEDEKTIAIKQAKEDIKLHSEAIDELSKGIEQALKNASDPDKGTNVDVERYKSELETNKAEKAELEEIVKQGENQPHEAPPFDNYAFSFLSYVDGVIYIGHLGIDESNGVTREAYESINHVELDENGNCEGRDEDEGGGNNGRYNNETINSNNNSNNGRHDNENNVPPAVPTTPATESTIGSRLKKIFRRTGPPKSSAQLPPSTVVPIKPGINSQIIGGPPSPSGVAPLPPVTTQPTVVTTPTSLANMRIIGGPPSPSGVAPLPPVTTQPTVVTTPTSLANMRIIGGPPPQSPSPPTGTGAPPPTIAPSSTGLLPETENTTTFSGSSPLSRPNSSRLAFGPIRRRRGVAAAAAPATAAAAGLTLNPLMPRSGPGVLGLGTEVMHPTGMGTLSVGTTNSNNSSNSNNSVNSFETAASPTLEGGRGLRTRRRRKSLRNRKSRRR